jgi:hypothetical protein
LASRYLAGAGAFDGIPLFTREELREELRSFREFLLADRQHLLQTGLPSKKFSGSRWLCARAAKLYVTHCTEQGLPYDKPLPFAGQLLFYKWVRIVTDQEKLVVTYVPCRQENADLFPGIRGADADRLRDIREKILDLKLAVLAAAEEFLGSTGTDDFLGQCVPFFRAAVTAGVAEFCMDMDCTYKEISETLKSTNRDLWILGHDWPSSPGGFTSIFELIGHVEKESKIGTMHRTREALGDLAAVGSRRALSAEDPEWSYVEFIDHPDIERLHRAIDIFRDCDAREAAFWGGFQERVSAMIAGELEREVTVHLRARPHVAEPLRLNVQTYGDWAKSHFGASGSLPVLGLAEPGVMRSSGEGENVFRKRGDDWEIRFKDGNLNRFPNLAGMFYLSLLVRSPGKHDGIFPTDLRVARARENSDADRRTEDGARSAASERSADGLSPLGSFQAQIELEDLKRIREERREVLEKLVRARRDHDDAKIQELEKDLENFEKYLREALVPSRDKGKPPRNKGFRARLKNDRDTVLAAIETSLEKIERKDPIAAAHLRNSLRYGPLLTYEPESKTVWNP